MLNTIFTSTALLAVSASALSVGNAIVINKCNYDVKLCNVPSDNGGYSLIDKMLAPNEQYSQQWTQLTNNNGWSIKMSNDSTLDNILQYEYTFHNDGTIWYDLSEVNGNPWDGNWEITAQCASQACTPKQQAYRYATDDAYGMQACNQDADITVTLCSGESQNDGGAASLSSSYAAETSSLATATSYSAVLTSSQAAPTVVSISASAAPTVLSTSSWTAPVASSSPSAAAPIVSSSSYEAAPTHHHPTRYSHYAVPSSATPTTFATLTSTSTSVVTDSPYGVTVTEVETAVVTEYVTATWAGNKRHMGHNARHPHV